MDPMDLWALMIWLVIAIALEFEQNVKFSRVLAGLVTFAFQNALCHIFVKRIYEGTI